MREKEYEYEIAGGDDEKITAFFHALDTEVFPKIDFEKYLEACNKHNTEYPSELLGMFHQAFVSVYGNNPITQADTEWIICPAVLRSKATGQILIGLVELDLSSSGEHWGTNFLSHTECTTQMRIVSAKYRNICARFSAATIITTHPTFPVTSMLIGSAIRRISGK